MKYVIKFNFLLFTIALLIGLSFAACDNDPQIDRKSAGAAVEAPTLDSKTHDTITINAVSAPANGQSVEYAINTADNTNNLTWQNGLVFDGLNAQTNYYIFARSAENDSYRAGTPSNSLFVETEEDPNKEAGAAVDQPTLDSVTSTSITINEVTPPVNGQSVEYAYNTANNVGTGLSPWQNGLTFSNLTAGTAYYIFARSQSNATHNAGAASMALQVTTEAAASIAMKLISQTTLGAGSTPDNPSFIALNEVDDNTWRWTAPTGSPAVIISLGTTTTQVVAGGSPSDNGVRDGTLLYADTIPPNGYTLEAKIRVTRNDGDAIGGTVVTSDATRRQTGVFVGSFANAPAFNTITDYKLLSALLYRPNVLRHYWPVINTGNAFRGSVPEPNTEPPNNPTAIYTFKYTVTGDGTAYSHYPGGTLTTATGTPLWTLPGVSLQSGETFTFENTDLQLYPGIMVYNADIEIHEITLIIEDPELRIALTPDSVPTVLSGTTTVNVTFKGSAEELEDIDLTEADFSVNNDATIGTVNVSGDTVTVPVTFGVNMTESNRTFTVSTDSDTVVAATSAVITQSARKVLNAVQAQVPVAHNIETANAVFSGVDGLTALEAADFTVVSGDATIGTVSIEGDNVTVSVTFDANAGSTEISFVIGINSDSTHIRGSATVTINQSPEGENRTALVAGPSPVPVGAGDTSAEVTFTGADGLSLTDADFTVTAPGQIDDVTVTGDTVTVTVTFAANNVTSPQTYTVGINEDSAVIYGPTVTVTITQAAFVNPITMSLVSQSTTTAGTTADNPSLITLQSTGENVWQWTGTQTITSAGQELAIAGSGGSATEASLTAGTLLYADIGSNNGFTLVAKINITDNTTNQTGVVVGSFADVTNFKSGYATAPGYKRFVGIHNRPGGASALFFPLTLTAGSQDSLRGNASTPNTPTVLNEIYTFTFNVGGNGTLPAHYPASSGMSGNSVNYTYGAAIETGGAAGERVFNANFFGETINRYPGIVVYGSTATISEITLTVVPGE